MQLLTQHFEVNLKNPFSSTNQESFDFLFFLLTCSLKDKSFSFEKEIRAVYYSNNIINSLTLENRRNKKIEPWFGAEYLSDFTVGKAKLPIVQVKLGPKFDIRNEDSEKLILHCKELGIKVLDFK